MSSHHNHDSHGHTPGDFVPLSDNNANLSPAKVISMVLGLALLIFTLVATISLTKGYLQNEQQADWKLEHNKPFKDSHENWYYKSAPAHEAKEVTTPETKHGEDPKKEEAKPAEHSH